MLTSKELMQLEDFLDGHQTSVKTFNHFASEMQDQQGKQMLQQLAQKHQQHVQMVSKHLNAGQSLQ
jgi:rubrerythrin